MSSSVPFPGQLMEFWMGKAVEWDQTKTPAVQFDVSLHLGQLRSFLQDVFKELHVTSSTREAIERFPFIGQLLGRLCWNLYVTADEESRDCLLRCLCCMYSAQPQGAVELKANQWIQNLLCLLSTEDDSSTAQAVFNHVGCTPREYHLEVLKNMVAWLVKDITSSSCYKVHELELCSYDKLYSVSLSSIPLVTCPEATPLIGALLQCPAALNEGFLEAVSEALLSKKLILKEPAVVALWCQSLTSLESATLHLLESVLSNLEPFPQELEQQVIDSLLPRASALHCPLFLVVNDIFRTVLLGLDANVSFRALLQAFTRCFLCTYGQVEPQERLPLKTFFPHAPLSILMPLLKLPSEVPEEAWSAHLLWISCCLHTVVEEEEKVHNRWHHRLFESWFLLLQCSDWVDVAAQVLVTSSQESSTTLLWLLAFYYHPANNEQQRTQALAVAKAVLDHLRVLFTTATPPPLEHLQAFMGLMTTHSSHPATTRLILQLMVNFATFSHWLPDIATELFHLVKVRCGFTRQLLALLAGIEHRLNGRETHERLKNLRTFCIEHK
ncbi:Fanconi anemia group C protein [Scleropages formosus]|uniref:Fanconi anemia group C protein n=1 Tax=Scleropages formosus TaxID=113540 RepID=UPI0008789C48|nr:Fanconi anemia group C protein [Scleropages formosus]